MNPVRIYSAYAVFCILIALLVAAAGYFIGQPYLHEKIWVIYAFHLITGAVFLFINHISYLKGDEFYVTGSLAALVIRFLSAGIFAAVFILKDLPGERWFIADFLLLYLFFSVFEITVIISNLRAQKNT